MSEIVGFNSTESMQTLKSISPPFTHIEVEFWNELDDQKIPLSEQRIKHHTTGRKVAVSALKNLLNSEISHLEKNEDGLPAWPLGCTGSISHTQGAAIAIVGDNNIWGGLGIDIEIRKSQYDPIHIQKLVMTDSEELILKSAFPELGLADHILSLFCIKESVYKAAFPKLRQAWEFSDLQLIQLDTNGFICRPYFNNQCNNENLNYLSFYGNVYFLENHIISVAIFPNIYSV